MSSRRERLEQAAIEGYRWLLFGWAYLWLRWDDHRHGIRRRG